MSLDDLPPAPPVPLPARRPRRGRRVLLALGGVALVGAVVGALVLSGVFDPGPGEPGWHPIVGSDVGGDSTTGEKIGAEQQVTNTASQQITVERIRSEPPKGYVELDAGFVPANSWKWLDVFDLAPVTKPPVSIPAGHRAELWITYRASCRPAQHVSRVQMRVVLTVSMGAVRQDVEVPDTISIAVPAPDPALPPCP
ncbi:hypothetical protein F0L68_35360 [Solihabitans fulvus]|uniref:Uncharacterized protein n=1 Tax=Solihabitans fulvus TaxID=1892852 RepID=A0A5B2WQ66_9PSEU|nr:hypothetical protein [Solihabitans fulvus]KAA2252589.1 hypothetical protein F0L68_35360 [Solihabitans fulvus]